MIRLVNGYQRDLQGNYLSCPQAFGIMLDGKFDALTLFEVTEALGLDCAVMNKNILAILARDEAIAFGAVEPFYSSSHSFVHGQILLSLRL
jgi:hypothetical protein